MFEQNLSQNSLNFKEELETNIPSGLPQNVILQCRTRTPSDTCMTAGYSMDGEMIHKSSVKSESHTLFYPSEIPSISEEVRKKCPLAMMLNSQNVLGTMPGGTTEEKFSLNKKKQPTWSHSSCLSSYTPR